ncbi:MAG: hypothetical protein LBQ54_01620 [Planctomycetaceae bacterium]|nr:hypothetical protein [Planctomycetaceae bacterium]
MTNSQKTYLPSLSEILASPNLRVLAHHLHPVTFFATATGVLNEMATEAKLAASERRMPDIAELAEKIAAKLHLVTETPARPAINATGILLHPEYGIPAFSPYAIDQMNRVLCEGGSQEIQASVSRDTAFGETDISLPLPKSPIKVLLAELTGAMDAVVFNSHAGALATLFSVLRGDENSGSHLILSVADVAECRDGTQIADFLPWGNFVQKVVGTIHRTTFGDYETALKTEEAGVLFCSDATNACFHGLKSVPPLGKLAELAAKYHSPLLYDSEWGTLYDTVPFGLEGIPVIRDIVKQGVSLVIFSTGRLNGGPDLTVLAGDRTLIGRIRMSRLTDAFAPTAYDIAALETTLALFLTRDRAEMNIPICELISTNPDNLKLRANRIASQITVGNIVSEVTVRAGFAPLVPDRPFYKIPTWQVVITLTSRTANDVLQQFFRIKPGMAVLSEEADRLVLDMRTVFARQDILLVETLREVLCPSKT